MNLVQTTNLSQLPLSWARTNTAVPTFNTVNLPLTSAEWIPLAEIPHDTSFEQLYQEHLRPLTNGVILQSVNVGLRDYLLQQGWYAAAMGAEAILDLPWRGKRSVRELARRGRRHGTIQEVENSHRNQAKLAKLMRRSPSRQGIQLKYTERPDFDDSTRLFVFATAEQQWLGAITISTNAASSAHTELLIRHQDAPTGIMEALITAITQQLADEGFIQLSLGNVPPLPTAENDALFAQHRHPNDLWRRSQWMFKLGQRFNFAYSAKGLRRFKNKFSPRWEPLYLVASTRISWRMIAGLVQATGYLRLVQNSLSKLWPTLPTIQWRRPSTEVVALSKA
ncbi:MAG: phosphatidylglycerol lysyltransferase domain-containing protein [Chloroflexota bacterium]